MTINEAQQQVDQWIKTHGVRYFSELTNKFAYQEGVGVYNDIGVTIFRGGLTQVPMDAVNYVVDRHNFSNPKLERLIELYGIEYYSGNSFQIPKNSGKALYGIKDAMPEDLNSFVSGIRWFLGEDTPGFKRYNVDIPPPDRDSVLSLGKYQTILSNRSLSKGHYKTVHYKIDGKTNKIVKIDTTRSYE